LTFFTVSTSNFNFVILHEFCFKNNVLLPIKSHKTWKKAMKNVRLSRAVAAAAPLTEISAPPTA
jgi:hypothetical protein